jgi:hypothetical protein
VSDVPRATKHPQPPTPTEELHIIRKLGQRPDFFCGAVTPRERGERLRRVLDQKRVGHIPVFRGDDETWYDACLRWYGVGELTDQPQGESVHA